MNSYERTTSGIANKGFRGMRRVAARFYICCNLTGNHPETATAYTGKRYV